MNILEQRLKALFVVQNEGLLGLHYAATFRKASSLFKKEFDLNAGWGDLYYFAELRMILSASLLFDKNDESVNLRSICNYARSNLNEFTWFHQSNQTTLKKERNKALLKAIDSWDALFEEDFSFKSIKTVRDKTLAHLDKQAVHQPNEIPLIPVNDIITLFENVHKFVNDLMGKISNTQMVTLHLEDEAKNNASYLVATHLACLDEFRLNERNFNATFDNVRAKLAQ